MSDDEAARNLELQLVQREIQKMEEQLLELERRKMELDIVSSSMDEIAKQQGDDVLIPIGSGVFVKGSLAEKNRVLINIGADVVVEKDFAEAKKIVGEQFDEISSLQKELEGEMLGFLKNVQQNKGRPQKDG